ncbi:hypothetical protein DPMN_123250 [Dreissena polymorpha]|uniref:Uncharacterized protein n=1 Tax=Dreissena polymorpha TaxID=45954 RepID=A0A9D4GU32_DREPO|nr:hypothetical protein DPMN_123250 [Dreissena polymorpha]
MTLYAHALNPIFPERVLNKFFQASFSITLADDDVSPGDIRAEVTGTDSTHKVHFNWAGRSGQGYFTASETGLHKVRKNIAF